MTVRYPGGDAFTPAPGEMDLLVSLLRLGISVIFLQLSQVVGITLYQAHHQAS
ncbi:MAG: hypothetical protein QNJ54_19300 [Prochloraceae cyanobacterium]|nr:hypothetical protein [Prochloraceae cyanobacterium]